MARDDCGRYSTFWWQLESVRACIIPMWLSLRDIHLITNCPPRNTSKHTQNVPKMLPTVSNSRNTAHSHTSHTATAHVGHATAELQAQVIGSLIAWSHTFPKYPSFIATLQKLQIFRERQKVEREQRKRMKEIKSGKGVNGTPQGIL